VPRRFDLLGHGAGWLRRSSLAAPIGADARAMAERLLTWARSREDCVEDAKQPSSGGGSGHLAVIVAGINSSMNGVTGAALPIDTGRLGYRDGEVHSFSYAPGGGPYQREDTWSALPGEADALGDQLRALQREQPGREVDLIAHSQGGVVVAEFLAHVYDAGDPTMPPLGNVVTLASPLRGAPVATALARVRASASGSALLDAVDAQARGVIPPAGARSTTQLAEDSGVMRRLGKSSLPEQIDLTSISAVDDPIVPADHTTVPGARTATVNPPGLSDHSAILRDPAALDTARLALELRPLPCVGVATGVRGAVEPVLISRAEDVAGRAGGALGRGFDLLLGKGDSR
jgi:pimeloyl-ACP methyl ester carboxylesterase